MIAVFSVFLYVNDILFLIQVAQNQITKDCNAKYPWLLSNFLSHNLLLSYIHT